MRKICVITGTRAEYHLLYHTMKAMESSPKLQLQLVATGSHLSPSHGLTINNIVADGFKIDYTIDMLLDAQNKSAIAKSMGLFMIQLAQCFDDLKPDMLLILGDRYEVLAAVSCAVAMNIPIAHIHGGESTIGAIDEQIRHAITKMAHLHFTATELYKNNILKMGEQAFRVFNTGAPIVENIRKDEFVEYQSLQEKLGSCIKRPLFLVTYHPVTWQDYDTDRQINNVINALSSFDGTFLLTGANADFSGEKINKAFEAYAASHSNFFFHRNLGKLYLSVCKYADVMVGNSSSGIAEAPCFRLPVVNIGDRQKGRLRHPNIIDVGCDTNQIISGIQKALSNDFNESIASMENLYGDGDVSCKIINILEKIDIDPQLLFKHLVWE